MYLNTSNVNVNRGRIHKKDFTCPNLNTSNVNVNLYLLLK